MKIREANSSDFEGIWPILSEIISAGDTYAYPMDTSKDEARVFWMDIPQKVFVAEDEEGDIIGTYYIKANQLGSGNHVCNCGYMVPASQRGKGIATAMCEHSQKIALDLGFKAMQFNFVASSNQGAIRLWKKLGFEEVGRLPKAFRHPRDGYIDALVFFKWLEN